MVGPRRNAGRRAPCNAACGIVFGTAITATTAITAISVAGCERRSDDPLEPPHLVSPDSPVAQASHERGTPPGILATVDQVRPPWNLGFRLVATDMGADWSEHRALVEDGTGLRSYAIGDLLPYGAVLVAVSTGAVQLMLGDVELVQLEADGSIASVQDFRSVYEPSRPPVVQSDPAFRQAILDVLAFLRSDDRAEVQGAIDALVEAGAPAVGVIVPYASSTVPVATSTYTFSFMDAAPRRAQVYGDIVVGILEAITGQTFGDPMAPGQTDIERQHIRRQWLRWWGVR